MICALDAQKPEVRQGTKHIAERTAAAVLQGLGISVGDAKTITRWPLPVLETPPAVLVRETSS